MRRHESGEELDVVDHMNAPLEARMAAMHDLLNPEDVEEIPQSRFRQTRVLGESYCE